MHTGKPKITKRQRHELVQIYLHMGVTVAQNMCVEYGMHFQYAQKQASEMGLVIRMPRKNRGGPYKTKTGRTCVDHKDPRWAWAIKNGPVIV